MKEEGNASHHEECLRFFSLSPFHLIFPYFVSLSLNEYLSLSHSSFLILSNQESVGSSQEPQKSSSSSTTITTASNSPRALFTPRYIPGMHFASSLTRFFSLFGSHLQMLTSNLKKGRVSSSLPIINVPTVTRNWWLNKAMLTHPDPSFLG